jgi:hypothetical protein
MFLQWLYMYVASVCPQCFIYSFRRMLQVCLSRCCICFTHMLQVFYLHVAYVSNGFQVFFASVSDTCFKCFISLHTYVASVASGYVKSRSGVTHGMCMVSGKRRQRSPWGAHVKSRHSRGCRVQARTRKRIDQVHGII